MTYIIKIISIIIENNINLEFNGEDIMILHFQKLLFKFYLLIVMVELLFLNLINVVFNDYIH
jgi:hypothetical protein